MVISLKEEFYSHADALVGITTNPQEMKKSGTLVSKVIITLDIIPWPKHYNKTQGFRVELQVLGGVEEVTGKGQNRDKTRARKGQDRDK